MINFLIPLITERKIRQFIFTCLLHHHKRVPTKDEINYDISVFKISMGVSHYSNTNYFVLNLKQIKNESFTHKEFIHNVARVINHEIIHHVLFELEGRYTSSQYDFIYQILRLQGYEMS